MKGLSENHQPEKTHWTRLPHQSYREAQRSPKAKRWNNSPHSPLPGSLHRLQDAPQRRHGDSFPTNAHAVSAMHLCASSHMSPTVLEPQPARVASIPTVLCNCAFLVSFPGSTIPCTCPMGICYSLSHLDCKLCQGRSYLLRCQNLAGSLRQSQWVFLNRTLLRYYPHTLQFIYLF